MNSVIDMLIMIPAFSVLYTLLREISRSLLGLRKIPEEKLLDHPPELGERAHERLFKFKKKKKKVEASSEPTNNDEQEQN